MGVRKVRWRPYIAALLDLELPQAAGLTPVIQLGVCGGLTAGLLLRTSSNSRR